MTYHTEEGYGYEHESRDRLALGELLAAVSDLVPGADHIPAPGQIRRTWWVMMKGCPPLGMFHRFPFDLGIRTLHKDT